MPVEETRPLDKARRWQMEFDAARKSLKKWHEAGDMVVKRYLDERDEQQDGRTSRDSCLTLFTSNVQTQMAMMYGQTPRVSVSRRFSDAQDDVARVAGVIGERALNTDIQKEDDTFAEALWNALEDYELPGLGMVRLRYVVEMEPVEAVEAQMSPEGVELAPAVPATEKKTRECVETDYVHWRDVLYSPSRTFADLRWLAFRAQMTREEMDKRFGKAAKLVSLNAKKDKQAEGKAADPWDRADVWEVWDKEHREVVWFVDGHPVLLDEKSDPLGLTGFWPCPKPMMANTTTTAFVPKPFYALTQDQYRQIDLLTTRIHLLVEAVRVAGVYDRASPDLARLVNGRAENVLIPVDNWAAFAEKGGVKGVIDWLPLDQVVNALTVLRDNRRELIETLHQLTGMSDIMRGQATQTATATEQRIKANFGSVRMQRLQNEFARFASDAQRIKFEIIAKHFDPATILAASNIERTPDAKFAQEAVALIKSQSSEYRVEVKPEAIAMTDFSAQKQDAAEFIGGVATFLQAATPLAQAMPSAMPYLLKMMQWSVSKFRGAAEIEGVLDEAIEAAEQAAQQPQQSAPDPKLQVLQMKGQQDLAKIDKELQADLIRTQADTAAEEAKQRSQAEWNHQEKLAESRIPKPPVMSGGVRR